MAQWTPFDPTTYTRRVDLIDVDAITVLSTIGGEGDSSSGADDSLRLISHIEFEWLRQGGCGAGAMEVTSEFLSLGVEIGQHIKIYYGDDSLNVPWYMGRIEEITETSPSGGSIRMYGLFSHLNDITIGGRHDEADVPLPHLFARSQNQFRFDPDFAAQTWIPASNYYQFADWLYDNAIFPNSPIARGDIDDPSSAVSLQNNIFRGEETVASIIKQVSVSQYGSSFGVNAKREFFMTQKPDQLSDDPTFQEGVDVTSLSKQEDRSLIINSLTIVGGYIYSLNIVPGGFWRYAKKFLDADSIAINRERNRQVYLPWIRTDVDANSFALRVFDDYADAIERYTFTTLPVGAPLFPWDSQIAIKDRNGDLLRHSTFDRVTVEFDEAPVLTITVGPEDFQFPKPIPHTWELNTGGRKDDDSSGASSDCDVVGDLRLLIRGETREDISGNLEASGKVFTMEGGPGNETIYCNVDAYYRPDGTLPAGTRVLLYQWTNGGTDWWEAIPVEPRYKTLIVKTQISIQSDEIGWVDVMKGPLGAEAAVPQTDLLVYNRGPAIPGDTWCEAIHYSQRVGGQPYVMNSSQEGSWCDLSNTSSGRDSEKEAEGCIVEYEIIPLECG